MSKVETLRQDLLRLYREHLAAGMIPTSARFLFYELVQKGVILKQASGVLRPGAKGQRRPDQDMLDALTNLRESGQIPWDAIVDETRSLDDFTGYRSIAEGVEAYLNDPTVIRLDRWNGSAPLILTESRSLAGVLRALVREYGALIAPTNGQAAGFLHNDVAPKLSDGARVLYLGDYDLAGGDIEDNTKRVLERYHPLAWERLALTADQVRDYGLTRIIKRDGRFKSGGAHEAVETEALSQRVIVEIVRARLDVLLPAPLDAIRVREEEERERLRRRLRLRP
jgi:hypothetical protein